MPSNGRRPETMLLLLLLLLCASATAAAAAAGDDLCPERAPEALYSSKTAYQLVHDGDHGQADRIQGCEAAYFWHLLRHGTRFPSEKEIADLGRLMPGLQARLRANLAAGRVPLCRAVVDRLLSWTLNASGHQGNALAPQGERDMLGVGARFKAKYPAFLREHPLPDAFTFRSTASQRTLASAKWYATGMFDRPVDVPKPLEDDPLLKFYAMCPAWDAAVDNNASAHVEVSKFQEGAEVRAALDRVSRRLGFADMLTYEEVDMLWEVCRYDQAWDPNTVASWCLAFNEEDLLVFEYRADIKYYYVGGYGSPMDLQLGCPLVKDIVEKLSAYERGQTAKRGNMYFTHSTAFHMTMARLGIASDPEPLTSHNYERMKRARRWAISKLGPFAANLAVVLYECPSGERHRVRMYLNEKPTPVQGCTDADSLCSWNDFKRRFSEIAQSCSLDFCNSAAHSSWNSISSHGVIGTAALIASAILR